MTSRNPHINFDNPNEIWKSVKENRNKLDACTRHNFTIKNVPMELGAKVKCNNCGGWLDLTRVNDYCRGYKAAGGNPNDIVEGFE